MKVPKDISLKHKCAMLYTESLACSSKIEWFVQIFEETAELACIIEKIRVSKRDQTDQERIEGKFWSLIIQDYEHKYLGTVIEWLEIEQVEFLTVQYEGLQLLKI